MRRKTELRLGIVQTITVDAAKEEEVVCGRRDAVLESFHVVHLSRVQ